MGIMGTGADFYVGKGKKARWVGSVGSYGHPETIPKAIWNAKNAREYRQAVRKFLKDPEIREVATLPEEGWPWSWDNSYGTDYSFTFDKGFHISSWGCNWIDKKTYRRSKREWDAFEIKYQKFLESLERYETGKRKTKPIEPEEPEDTFDEERTVFPDMNEMRNVDSKWWCGCSR